MQWFCPKKREVSWKFRNGTVVEAQTYDAAVRRLFWVFRKECRAAEREPGLWDVQFNEWVRVENIQAIDLRDAVDLAIQALDADGYEN